MMGLSMRAPLTDSVLSALKRRLDKYSGDRNLVPSTSRSTASVIVPGSILRTTGFIVTARLRKERAFASSWRS